MRYRFTRSLTVSSPSPSAIFAPVDSAITGTVADGSVLAGHVVPGVFTTADIIANGCVEVTSLSGQKLRIRYWSGRLQINDADVICDDSTALGGNVIGIDSVIPPGSFRPCRNGYVEQAFDFGIPDPATMPFGSMYDRAWRTGGYGLLLSSITRSTGVMATIEEHYPVSKYSKR